MGRKSLGGSAHMQHPTNSYSLIKRGFISSIFTDWDTD